MQAQFVLSSLYINRAEFCRLGGKIAHAYTCNTATITQIFLNRGKMKPSTAFTGRGDGWQKDTSQNLPARLHAASKP
jgi:hypothetical protein